MATDKPISGFDTLAAVNVSGADELIIVDVSDTSQAPTGSTKNVLLSSLLNNPNNGVVTGILVPILGTASAGRIVKTVNNGFVFQSPGGSLTDYAFLDSAGNSVAALRASDSSLSAVKFLGLSATPVLSETHSGTIGSSSLVGSDSGGTISLLSLTGTFLTLSVAFSNPYGSAPAVVFSPGSNAIPSDTYLSAVSTTGFTVTLGAAGMTSITAQKLHYIVMGRP